jgi:uncharacterized membrane protein
MLFDDKVRQRRKLAGWISFGYAIGDAIITTVIAFFVLWVAMPLMDQQYRTVVCALLGVTNLLSFMAGWNANRVHKSSIDLWIRDADPLELNILKAGIEVQHAQLERYANSTAEPVESAEPLEQIKSLPRK